MQIHGKERQPAKHQTTQIHSPSLTMQAFTDTFNPINPVSNISQHLTTSQLSTSQVSRKPIQQTISHVNKQASYPIS